jgi:hypothetical protein
MVMAAAAAASPDVTAVPQRPCVGEVIFLSMQPDRELLRASCSWGGASYQLALNGGAYEAVLPVSLATKPGGYHAALYWKCADGTMGSRIIPIEVRARKFGIQRLRLSARQESTYSAPQTQRERDLIGAALDLVTPERRWKGNFAMPVHGRVSTEFGLQRYVNGKFDYRHRGVDLACPEGTPVRAAADGVVSLADGSFVLHGQTVILDHGEGVSTVYLHMSAIDVAPGAAVQQGQVIGRVGSTGVATGPHLHFAAYAHHEAVDPFFWMSLPLRQ